MISREKMVRLIEAPSLTGSLSELNESLASMMKALEGNLLSLLTGEPQGEDVLKKQLGVIKKMQTGTDSLLSRFDATKSLFEEGEISGIEDLRTKVFPRIVEYNVIQLLKVRNPKDIPLVNSILAQLREKGVSAVWERILPGVTAHTDRLCGLIFPREYIQEGKALPLDMGYLSSVVEAESAAVTQPSAAVTAAVPKRPAPLVTTGSAEVTQSSSTATAAASRGPTSDTSYFGGFRPGFLNGRSTKPAQDPEAHNKDGSSDFRPK